MDVEVKTVARNGLIMFSTDSRNIDYTGIFIREGKVVFGWDYGSGPELIESPEPINDGNWHKVSYFNCILTGLREGNPLEQTPKYLGISG